jgi:hypothetical protein
MQLNGLARAGPRQFDPRLFHTQSYHCFDEPSPAPCPKKRSSGVHPGKILPGVILPLKKNMDIYEDILGLVSKGKVEFEPMLLT